MIETKMICDLCGTEVKDKNQFWEISLYLSNPSNTFITYNQRGDHKKKADACRECMEKRGLLPNMSVPAEEVKTPTIDDFIRDIVRQEIEK